MEDRAGRFDLHAHAQPLGRFTGVGQQRLGRIGVEHIIRLVAGDVKAELRPAVIALRAVVGDPNRFQTGLVRVIVEMRDQLQFVRVAAGKILFEPIKADQFQMLVSAGFKAVELLVEHPLDCRQTVGKPCEVLRNAVAVQVAELRLRFDRVHTG